MWLQIDYDSSAPSQHLRLRSAEVQFNYSTHCLFCGTPDIYDGKKNEFKLVLVRTYDFQKTVIHASTQRNDEWGHKVKARIEFVYDLDAADANIILSRFLRSIFLMTILLQNVLNWVDHKT